MFFFTGDGNPFIVFVYKSDTGRVEFDGEQETFHDKVLDTRDKITLMEKTVDEFDTAFRESTDEYLEFSKEMRGKKLNNLFPEYWCCGSVLNDVTRFI